MRALRPCDHVTGAKERTASMVYNLTQSKRMRGMGNTR